MALVKGASSLALTLPTSLVAAALYARWKKADTPVEWLTYLRNGVAAAALSSLCIWALAGRNTGISKQNESLYVLAGGLGLASVAWISAAARDRSDVQWLCATGSVPAGMVAGAVALNIRSRLSQ